MDLDGRGVGGSGGVEGGESVIRTYVRKKSTVSKRREKKTQGRWWKAWPQRPWGNSQHTALLHFLPRKFECEQLQMRLWILPLCK